MNLQFSEPKLVEHPTWRQASKVLLNNLNWSASDSAIVGKDRSSFRKSSILLRTALAKISSRSFPQSMLDHVERCKHVDQCLPNIRACSFNQEIFLGDLAMVLNLKMLHPVICWLPSTMCSKNKSIPAKCIESINHLCQLICRPMCVYLSNIEYLY